MFFAPDIRSSRGTVGGTLVYDPLSNSWTEERDVPWRSNYVAHACAHDGRIVAFTDDRAGGALGSAYQRASDGSWSPYYAGSSVGSLLGSFVGSESLLLG